SLFTARWPRRVSPYEPHSGGRSLAGQSPPRPGSGGKAAGRGRFFPDAAGKAYYAMFYAAQALLKAHGIEVVKHSAVASMLGRHFAKSGRFDPKFHRMFLNACRVREVADYGIFEEVVEPTANLTLDEGRSFVVEVERLLWRE